jgi:hypothetical protein
VPRGENTNVFIVAALGSIPWIGGVLAAAASLSAEKDQEKLNDLQRLWLEEHEEKMRDLGTTFLEIFQRLDNFGEEVQQQIESPEYLALVKKAFRAWPRHSGENWSPPNRNCIRCRKNSGHRRGRGK